MSKDLVRGELKLNDDYKITKDILISSVSLPGKFLLLIIPIVSITLTAGVVLYFENFVWDIEQSPRLAMTIAFVSGISVFFLGLIGGKIWQIFGRILATATYMVYLQENKSIFQRIFGWFYTKFIEKDAQVYLEARAEDPRLGNIFNLFKLIARISISQVSFFIVATRFLSRPVVSYVVDLLPGILTSKTGVVIAQNIIALALSILFMSIYLPMSFLIEDSNIRTWVGKERTISTPSASVRGQIDSLISFSAVLTGWGIYLEQINDQGTLFVFQFIRNQWVIGGIEIAVYLDYALWLGGLIILSWPLILPAAYYYFLTHHSTINQFRAVAHSKGVPIGVAKIRLPESDEVQVIREFIETSE